MSLPAAYRPFHEVFGLMSAPMTTVLGGVLRALDPPPTPHWAEERQPRGAFVGHDGLASRGELADLAISEWLIRDIDPDEFVRRLAESEAVFRQPDYADPGKRAVLAAIVDCGPWMLGGPRLAALAALFYLALRAERAGAGLIWAIPDGSGQWREGLTKSSIRTFLGVVLQTPAGPDQIDQTLASVEGDAPREAWYVGAARTDLPASFRIGRVPGDVDRLTIDVSMRGRHLAEVEVTLPDQPTCRAALRRPFEPKAAAAEEPVLQSVGVIDPERLSDSPWEQHWMLDRTNRAVLVRVPEGLLWQPVDGRTGTWFPLTRPLLGIDMSGGLSSIVLGDHAEATLHRVVSGKDGVGAQKLMALAGVQLGPYPPNAIPIVSVSSTALRTKIDGAFEGAWLSQKANTNGDVVEDGARTTLVYCDANYAVVRAGRQLMVFSLSRSTIMLEVPAADLPLEGPRRVLFSPSSHMLAITGDDRTWHLRGQPPNNAPDTIDLPEQHQLLGISGPDKLIVWNGARRRVERVARVTGASNALGDRFSRATGIRHCPLSGTVFAMEVGETGLQAIVPLSTRRAWSTARRIDILDAIEKAETVWLDT